jgi:hypothetical protein
MVTHASIADNSKGNGRLYRDVTSVMSNIGKLEIPFHGR